MTLWRRWLFPQRKNLQILSRNSSQFDKKSLSWKDRMQSLLTEYGKIAIATHAVLSICSFSAVYAGVRHGIDVGSIVERLGISGSHELLANSENAIVSYGIYKLLAPVRWPLTFAITPLVAKVLRSRGHLIK